MLVFRLQRLVCAVVCASCPALTAGGAMIFEETLPTQTIMVQGQQAVGAIGVSFAGFNSQGGNRVLLGARVTISQTGSALMALDNEDEQVGGDVIAVVARSFSVFGPGISSDGLDIFDQANSAIVTLTASTEQPAGDPVDHQAEAENGPAPQHHAKRENLVACQASARQRPLRSALHDRVDIRVVPHVQRPGRPRASRNRHQRRHRDSRMNVRRRRDHAGERGKHGEPHDAGLEHHPVIAQLADFTGMRAACPGTARRFDEAARGNVPYTHVAS